MLIDIQLKNFRSYEESSFEFAEGVNIIVGPNASGKSNLLESILVLARGKSYRAADSDLLRFKADWARIDGLLGDGSTRTVKYKITHEKLQKTYEFNEKTYVRLTHQHTIPVVLFEPNNLFLLIGQPDARRSYLDDLLEQIEPNFASVRAHYKRVLSQRNALLKRQPPNIAQQMFVWNVRLSELGGYLARSRTQLVVRLQKVIGELYKNIAATKTEVSAEYISALPEETYESTFLRRLETSLEKDMIRGFTTVGPHRDDLLLRFNGVPAAETASRGETRTALLALKLFELTVLEEVRGAKPLLLLDDVFSELDGKRRHALTDYLQKYQTFITTTDADVVGKKFSQRAHTITF